MDRHRPRRAGFTLVEILIVVVIIGILVALLVPAVAAAFRRAREARDAAELNNLATALASFKNTFGDYPPSRVVLCEAGTSSISATFLNGTIAGVDTSDTDLTGQQLVNRSLLFMRKFWPRCDFVNPPNLDPSGNPKVGFFNDFNGDRMYDTTPRILTGSECLAFFLGGLTIRTVDASNNTIIGGLTGFSKSPQFPFVDSNSALNRTVPNYEFVSGRLVDFDGNGLNGNGFPSYVDSFSSGPTDQVAFAYFSAYGASSYDPNDNNSAEVDDQTTANHVERGFTVNYPVYQSGTLASYAISPGPNPYTTGNEYLASGTSWVNPNSFQLFSAGADRFWGLGGQYTPTAEAGSRLPITRYSSNVTTGDPANIHNYALPQNGGIQDIRIREADNVTNFSGGRLD